MVKEWGSIFRLGKRMWGLHLDKVKEWGECIVEDKWIGGVYFVEGEGGWIFFKEYQGMGGVYLKNLKEWGKCI